MSIVRTSTGLLAAYEAGSGERPFVLADFHSEYGSSLSVDASGYLRADMDATQAQNAVSCEAVADQSRVFVYGEHKINTRSAADYLVRSGVAAHIEHNPGGQSVMAALRILQGSSGSTAINFTEFGWVGNYSLGSIASLPLIPETEWLQTTVFVDGSATASYQHNRDITLEGIDTTELVSGKPGFFFEPYGTAPRSYVMRKFFAMADRFVAISGLPAGYSVQIDGTIEVEDGTGVAVVDLLDISFPATSLKVLNTDGYVVESFEDEVWGGDSLVFTLDPKVDYVDFSEARFADGQNPPDGFLESWDVRTTFTVEDDAAFTGARRLKASTSYANQSLLYWSDKGTFDEGEILVRVYVPSANNHIRSVLNASLASSGNGNGYILDPSPASSLYTLKRRSGGSESTVGTYNMVLDDNEFYWLLLQREGDTIRTKVWAGLISDEPLDWQLEYTDPSPLAAGYAGISSARNGTKYWDIISLGRGVGVKAYPRGEVINADPIADITSPIDGVVFDSDEVVVFTGTGTDAEDGELLGASLVWSSDIDGELGIGNSLELSTLSLGVHVITLTATDAEGAVGTDSVVITVEQAQYAPQKPTISAIADIRSALLEGSAFVDDNADAVHVASRWQLDEDGGDFSDPLEDSGVDNLNLLSYPVAGLEAGTPYTARVQYQDNTGLWSSWSDPISFSTSDFWTECSSANGNWNECDSSISVWEDDDAPSGDWEEC